MKKILSLGFVSLLFLFLLAACGSGTSDNGQSEASDPEEATSETDGEVYELRLGHIATETNPYHLLALEFKELVEERSEGQVKINVFANGQLGQERELLESMQFGNMDLAVITSSPVTNFVPEFGILDVPYLFEDWDHVERFLDSDVAEELLKETDNVGINTYAFIPRGFRSVTNSKHPVHTPDDMKGLTLRVIESGVYLDTINEMGATATGMPWSDAFTAMQQGAIDGQENDYSINYTQNVFEVQKYLSLTEHIFAINTIMSSQTTMEKLPEDLQQLIADAAVDAAKTIAEHNREQQDVLKANLLEKGMEINEVDKELFMNAVPNTQEKYSQQFGETYFKGITDLR
ncbi:DctP family TRAP transporter solute-binding subunit [Halalkalibacter krulwichiae]|uniref:2,3-diketo-L-gulonate-binding periplasmic protein YiaO n=1 Tax=Halalkalibacter krulwichiae TaxID=199441 RepID=A0A1X9MHW7_9BACI|nr:DctP family TRAP transporter solute-binding subunit [Halalkalibacter krulwichiae]ARK32304.1 2,3-diketo-L-gulonate-binding periplasmic protein YiaO precursor [Halalkalibacter krulwichiae]